MPQYSLSSAFAVVTLITMVVSIRDVIVTFTLFSILSIIAGALACGNGTAYVLRGWYAGFRLGIIATIGMVIGMMCENLKLKTVDPTRPLFLDGALNDLVLHPLFSISVFSPFFGVLGIVGAFLRSRVFYR